MGKVELRAVAGVAYLISKFSLTRARFRLIRDRNSVVLLATHPAAGPPLLLLRKANFIVEQHNLPICLSAVMFEGLRSPRVSRLGRRPFSPADQPE